MEKFDFKQSYYDILKKNYDMHLNIVDQLRVLLDIKDSESRQEAVLSWFGTLSDKEKAEVLDYVQGLVNAMIATYQPIVDRLMTLGRQFVEHTIEWLNSNSEIQAYLEALKNIEKNK